MITLGIDPGLATLGMALCDDRGTLIDAGESLLLASRFSGNETDKLIQRSNIQAAVVAEWLDRADRICCERISLGMPNANGQIKNAIGWAIVLAVATAKQKPIQFISPQQWQRMILPSTDRKVDGDALYAKIQGYMNRQAATMKLHSHGLDAVGLAICGSMRWDQLTARPLGKTKTKKRKAGKNVQ
jgi:RNase H-fold protein (predicted Holliday junction resolvase)